MGWMARAVGHVQHGIMTTLDAWSALFGGRTSRYSAVSVDDVMALRPCMSRRRILEITRGRTRMGLRRILKMDDVSLSDRVWIVSQLMDERDQRKFAIDCAMMGMHDIPNPWRAEAYRLLEIAAGWAEGRVDEDGVREADSIRRVLLSGIPELMEKALTGSPYAVLACVVAGATEDGNLWTSNRYVTLVADAMRAAGTFGYRYPGMMPRINRLQGTMLSTRVLAMDDE